MSVVFLEKQNAVFSFVFSDAVNRVCVKLWSGPTFHLCRRTAAFTLTFVIDSNQCGEVVGRHLHAHTLTALRVTFAQNQCSVVLWSVLWTTVPQRLGDNHMDYCISVLSVERELSGLHQRQSDMENITAVM